MKRKMLIERDRGAGSEEQAGWCEQLCCKSDSIKCLGEKSLLVALLHYTDAISAGKQMLKNNTYTLKNQKQTLVEPSNSRLLQSMAAQGYIVKNSVGEMMGEGQCACDWHFKHPPCTK